MSGKKLVLLGVAALLAYGAWRVLGGGAADSGGKPPVKVSVAPVERRDVPLTLQSIGTAVTYQRVALHTRLESQVMEVKFRDGDYVNEGDLLFVLDDRSLKAQLNQLQANLARDRAQLENLRQQYARNRDLAKKGFESAASLDESKAAYESQRATLGAGQAAIDHLKVQLEYTRITAPISGRTGTINYTVGNNVRPADAQPLVTINQMKPMRVQTALPQKYLDAVRAAMAEGSVSVAALREGGGESLGALEYIDNAVDQSTGTFAARARFPNEDEKLWPGMYVTLTLTLGEEKQALTLPEVAVQHGQEGDFVFVIEGCEAKDAKSGPLCKAVKRDLKISRMQDSLAVVEQGVKEGEKVAVDGLLTLGEGSAVKVLEEVLEPKKAEP